MFYISELQNEKEMGKSWHLNRPHSTRYYTYMLILILFSVIAFWMATTGIFLSVGLKKELNLKEAVTVFGHTARKAKQNEIPYREDGVWLIMFSKHSSLLSSAKILFEDAVLGIPKYMQISMHPERRFVTGLLTIWDSRVARVSLINNKTNYWEFEQFSSDFKNGICIAVWELENGKPIRVDSANFNVESKNLIKILPGISVTNKSMPFYLKSSFSHQYELGEFLVLIH